MPISLSDLELSKSDQIALVSGEGTSLLRVDIPMPAPQVPFEDTLVMLSAF